METNQQQEENMEQHQQFAEFDNAMNSTGNEDLGDSSISTSTSFFPASDAMLSETLQQFSSTIMNSCITSNTIDKRIAAAKVVKAKLINELARCRNFQNELNHLINESQKFKKS